MSKGLEALERLVDGNLNEVNYYRQFCDSTTYIMKDKETIEKELKRLEELEITYSNCVIEGAKQKKVLEIIKNKIVDVILLKSIENVERYNERVYTHRQLTEEEYDLLKEVLL